MSRLTSADIEAALGTLPEWRLSDGTLIRNYTFADFAHALSFVNQVGELAESVNHHPDIDIRFNQVRLTLISHDTGSITRRDLRLAALIDERLSP